MNIIHRALLLLLVGTWFTPCSASIQKEVLSYNLQYSENPQSSCLQILLKSNVSDEGKYLVRFPIGTVKFSLRSFGKGITISDTNYPALKALTGQPGEKFEINYELCDQNPNKLLERPIIEDKRLLFKFESVFATPEHQPHKDWSIHIDASSLPNNFNIYTSQSNNTRKLSIHSTITNFKSLVMAGGEVQANKILVNKQPVTILNMNDISSLNHPPEFYLEKLIKAQRQFWQDNDFEHYLVVLFDKPCNMNAGSAAGIHLNNALILQLSNCQKENIHRNIWGLSHELFHAWLGTKMSIPLPQGSLQWFFEGFNDYYGLLFALKTGLINYEDYVELYNQFIRSYYLMPIKEISNQEIADNYAKDPQYHLLAQLRGHFFAKKLAIKLNLEGDTSLDALMQEIYKVNQTKSSSLLEKNNIENIFRLHLNESLWNDYINIIENGNLIEFSNGDLGIFSKVVYKDVEVPDLGFNVLNLIQSQTISDLDPKSSAFKAGLRDGQKIKMHNISLINTEREMTLWVIDEQNIKEVTFIPKKKKERIPQYVIVRN